MQRYEASLLCIGMTIQRNVLRYTSIQLHAMQHGMHYAVVSRSRRDTVANGAAGSRTTSAVERTGPIVPSQPPTCHCLRCVGIR
jgi:hypothetical protein